MRAAVTGATGLLGRALRPHFVKPIILSRNPDKAVEQLGNVTAHAWTPDAGPPPAEALRGTDVVFNLAGEPVADGRWTIEKRNRIRDSRVIGTQNLVAGLAGLDAHDRPKALISASAIGYYGDRGDEVLDEDAAVGRGFLAQVCADWESEAVAAEALGIRVVCIRFGLVLSASGGALARMLTPFRMGIGGRLGSGRQWMSWVHSEDAVGVMLHAAYTPDLRGTLNAVAPHPVTNADFTKALAKVLKRPALVPVPQVALQAMFGEMSEVILSSQRVIPRRTEAAGYVFRHGSIREALAHVFVSTSS
ncbi:MAG: TIGR01777 family protein [Deltaproteobacteria bacterium]|nr:TIGR01777 family protein [Deltaproteobacteria bacterium]